MIVNIITATSPAKLNNCNRQTASNYNLLTTIDPPQLDRCDRQEILKYFENAWQLEDILLKSLIGDDTFYLNPDPLRNQLIFYLGHSAVFYINKLIQVQLLSAGLNSEYESLFEIGVDPEIPEELDRAIEHCQWPTVREVWQYRAQAYKAIVDLIGKILIDLPIRPDRPLWALMMGIEHQRIHIETSSMLIRQLPIERVQRPENWNYAPIHGNCYQLEMIEIPGGVVKIGKAVNDHTYGWDIDYGEYTVEVSSFQASKYLVTNTDFLDFIKDAGYTDQSYWDESSLFFDPNHQMMLGGCWITSGTEALKYYRNWFRPHFYQHAGFRIVSDI